MFSSILAIALTVASPQVVEVEIASTPEEVRSGLQGRAPLGTNEGMLFILGEPTKARFWMKDVTFPIDMVFLNMDGSVDHIAAEVPPCPELPCPTYLSKTRVGFVLELPAGWAGRNGLVPGDVIQLDIQGKRVLIPVTPEH